MSLPPVPKRDTVLIVAKCNVNLSFARSYLLPDIVLIVAKCNVNEFPNAYIFPFSEGINSSKV